MTDSQFEEVWSDTSPTVCPINNSHTVDTSLVSAFESISESEVLIKEETVKTGGNFMCESHCLIAATGPGVTTYRDFIWPFPISVMSLSFVTDVDNSKDIVSCQVGPDTIIGGLVANCATGATGIYVSQTVVDNTMLGYHLNLFDGVNSDDLGRIISIDDQTNLIKVETGPSVSYSALTPTYVRMTVYTVNNYTIGKPGSYGIGKDKIGGSYVPENTIVRVNYLNTKSYPVGCSVQIEYLY